MNNDTVVQNVTIANGGTVSTALRMPKTFYLAGIIKDDTLDTSAAITFQVSMDGVTYFGLYGTTGSLVSYTVIPATAQAIVFPPSTFYPWEYVKIVVADAQTGITTIGCIIRQY